MIPKDIEKYVPVFFERDDKLKAFVNKFNELSEGFKSDTLGLNDLIDPLKIRSDLVDELGFWLNAGLKQTDTDRIKREKTANAVKTHKKRGSWNNDAKPKIDAIAGGDAKILRGFSGDDWILVGDGLTPSAYYWASMGCDGIDLNLGIALIGDGTEIEISGNIYIDVDNSGLTPAEIDAIVLELEDIAPAYMRIYIGYVDGGGNFILYTTMG